MSEEWQPISTAPKDGTIVELRFPPGRQHVRTGQEPRRVGLDERYSIGKWWSAEAIRKAVGKTKSETGPRGAMIARYGGYWGSAGNRSRPMTGVPTHWRTFTGELLHPTSAIRQGDRS